MDAMQDLVERLPYEEISVADIAQQATINRATFYAHFEDKSHLVESMIREGLEQAVLGRISHPAPFDGASLKLVAEATIEFLGSVLRPCERQASRFFSTFGPTVQETLERCFMEWIKHDPTARRRLRATPEALSNALAWSIYGAAVGWCRLAKRPDIGKTAEETVRIFLPALENSAR